MNKEMINEIAKGSHIEITDGDTDILAGLEELSIKKFALLEVMSWLSSSKYDVLKNQAPFHIAGYRDRLPLRYTAPLEGVKRVNSNENIAAALVGTDAFSQATLEYLMTQRDISGVLKDAHELLADNEVALSEEQVSRMLEQIEILESMQADYKPVSSTPRHSSSNHPFGSEETSDSASGYVPDDGKHTHGHDYVVATELEGIPISDDRAIPGKVA